jgi:undecaprenyl-diphosphatase
MIEWLESLTLGVVQGVTEFLPVSSDGHLVITQQAFAWLTGNARSGEENLFFIIMLHAGTLAAILVFYRKVILQGARGFLLGSKDVPSGFDRASIFRVGMLAFVATLPLIPLKLFLIDWLNATFTSGTAAGIGFLITAAVLLLVSVRMRGPDGRKGPTETTWLDALLIGIAQMFAPLPGVSRSGLTIASALGLGLSRSWAVGFSLLIAVPAITGAFLSELKDTLKNPQSLGLTPDRIAQTVTATILAGIVGYLAILWLIRVVRSGRLWYFSVYLVVMGVLVLSLASKTGGSSHVGPAKALDRTTGSALRRPDPVRDSRAGKNPLDRSDAAGTRSTDSVSRDTADRSHQRLHGALVGRFVAPNTAGSQRRTTLALGSIGPSCIPDGDPGSPGSR